MHSSSLGQRAVHARAHARAISLALYLSSHISRIDALSSVDACHRRGGARGNARVRLNRKRRGGGEGTRLVPPPVGRTVCCWRLGPNLHWVDKVGPPTCGASSPLRRPPQGSSSWVRPLISLLRVLGGPRLTGTPPRPHPQAAGGNQSKLPRVAGLVLRGFHRQCPVGRPPPWESAPASTPQLRLPVPAMGSPAPRSCRGPSSPSAAAWRRP